MTPRSWFRYGACPANCSGARFHHPRGSQIQWKIRWPLHTDNNRSIYNWKLASSLFSIVIITLVAVPNDTTGATVPSNVPRFPIDHSTFILHKPEADASIISSPNQSINNWNNENVVVAPLTNSTSINQTNMNGTGGGKHSIKFELTDHHQPKPMELDFSRFIRNKTPSTFRPTSPVLYLHPAKPRHISSIHGELLDIDLHQNRLQIEWQVVVVLKQNHSSSTDNGPKSSKIDNKRQTTNRNQKSKIRTKKETSLGPAKVAEPILARVESELDPLKWIVYLRKYGSNERRQFSIVDYDNTLDGPRTENKTYRYLIPDPAVSERAQSPSGSTSVVDDEVELLSEQPSSESVFQFEPNFPYEFCLQSLNGGQLQESEQFRKKFPMSAQTDLPGQRRNPLFICKEILIETSRRRGKDQKLQALNTHREDLVEGRSFIGDLALDQSQAQDENSLITLNQNSTDEFVMYTAISSGSTTAFVLIVVALFCCCKCRQNRIKSTTHQQLNRADLHHDSIRYNRAAVSSADDRFPYSYSPYYQPTSQHVR